MKDRKADYGVLGHSPFLKFFNERVFRIQNLFPSSRSWTLCTSEPHTVRQSNTEYPRVPHSNGHAGFSRLHKAVVMSVRIQDVWMFVSGCLDAIRMTKAYLIFHHTSTIPPSWRGCLKQTRMSWILSRNCKLCLQELWGLFLRSSSIEASLQFSSTKCC
jgi:hypothetical protein